LLALGLQVVAIKGLTIPFCCWSPADGAFGPTGVEVTGPLVFTTFTLGINGLGCLGLTDRADVTGFLGLLGFIALTFGAELDPLVLIGEILGPLGFID